jgi:hypothetical protein
LVLAAVFGIAAYRAAAQAQVKMSRVDAEYQDKRVAG